MDELEKVIKITVTCKHCNKKFIIRVKSGDLEKWKNGELIQKCFPYLTAGQRELLMTQTCDKCWNKIFPSF